MKTIKCIMTILICEKLSFNNMTRQQIGIINNILYAKFKCLFDGRGIYLLVSYEIIVKV